MRLFLDTAHIDEITRVRAELARFTKATAGGTHE